MQLCVIECQWVTKMTEASNIFWAAFGGGAAAGAVIGVIELLRWLSSRPLLKVEVKLGEIFGTFPDLYSLKGPLEQASYIFFEARNPHHVPVWVSSFGLDYRRPKGKKITILPQVGYQFPYEVVGGKELVQWKPIGEFLSKLRQIGERPSALKWVGFQASSGKVFRGKIAPKVIISLEKAFQTQVEATE